MANLVFYILGFWGSTVVHVVVLAQEVQLIQLIKSLMTNLMDQLSQMCTPGCDSSIDQILLAN